MDSIAAGIMGKLPTTTIDVRDMMCAQALALIAQAVERLPAGGLLKVRYNAPDVKQDLLLWARDRSHRVSKQGATTVTLQRS